MLIRDLKPTLHENGGREKLLLYESFLFFQTDLTRKLTITKQHDVSTTSCHHCEMSKSEITEGMFIDIESEKII